MQCVCLEAVGTCPVNCLIRWAAEDEETIG